MLSGDALEVTSEPLDQRPPKHDETSDSDSDDDDGMHPIDIDERIETAL